MFSCGFESIESLGFKRFQLLKAGRSTIHTITNIPRPHPTTGEYYSPPLGGEAVLLLTNTF
jgi:hypothetical protein